MVHGRCRPAQFIFHSLEISLRCREQCHSLNGVLLSAAKDLQFVPGSTNRGNGVSADRV
jgi:hypothetical protein